MTSPTLAAPNAQTTGIADASSIAETGAAKPRRLSVGSNAVLVLIVGALITAGLALGARVVHDANEQRLLRQRVREAAAVTGGSVSSIETPLSSAAVLAEATNGDPAAFDRFMRPIVDAGQPFVTVSLWRAGATPPRPLVVVGRAPQITSLASATAQDAFRRAETPGATFSVLNMLSEPDRRLGYAVASTQQPRYIVYGEAALPRERRARIESNSAFSDLNYALFLGDRANLDQLVASSTGGTGLHGRTASAPVTFGDAHLLVVMSPQRDLGGSLMANLWWLLALLGTVLTITAATLVERLTRRHRQAEELAQENAELYAAQRSVALSLQHSLLAEDFPDIEGLELSARYVAGTEGIDIGGDWYDVIALDGHRAMLTVGDVSGHGLQAATAMASLRFAIRAYATQGDTPGVILTKLSSLVNVRRDGHFATALCALIDLDARSLTCASAGHPQPLLIDEGGSTFMNVEVGLPVGVRGGVTYREVTRELPERGTLFLYTDGLIERRGETLNEGLERLARAVPSTETPLESTLSRILDGVIPQGAADDTALMGVRWTTN